MGNGQSVWTRNIPGSQYVSLVILLAFGVLALWAFSRPKVLTPADIERREQRAQTVRANREVGELLIAGLKQQGVPVVVEYRQQQVRIDPLVWSQMELRTKQRIVEQFAAYFGALSDLPTPVSTRILSNRNDTVLGEWGAFSDVTIHK